MADWEHTEYIAGWGIWRRRPHPRIELSVATSPVGGAYHAALRATADPGDPEDGIGGATLARAGGAGYATLAAAQAGAWALFRAFVQACNLALAEHDAEEDDGDGA